MKARVTIEYDLPQWDQAKLGVREHEERRWMASAVVRALPQSATIKVELVDA
jgi:hypothetical protein